MSNAVRGVAKALLWPFRRFFDPRFDGLARAIEVTHSDAAERLDGLRGSLDEGLRASNDYIGETRNLVEETRRLVGADMEASTEAMAVVGRSLTELRDITERTYELTAERYLRRLARGSIRDVDEEAARLLNYSVSHEGFAAQQHVWFNPPVLVEYAPGEARIALVNERIAEAPYVFRALEKIPRGANVLDVGAAESTVCLSVATLGYHVVAVDPRPNPLSHPNLRVVEGTVEELEPTTTFDAVICLSTIEHIGTGAYGQEVHDEDADLEAMRRMRELTNADGLLVLTTRYGTDQISDFERTYGSERLMALLDGWELNDLTLLERRDALTWLPVAEDEVSREDPGGDFVALVTATRRK